jgi:hypothetical protein
MVLDDPTSYLDAVGFGHHVTAELALRDCRNATLDVICASIFEMFAVPIIVDCP